MFLCCQTEGQVFHVSGELQTEGDVTYLWCSVNGVLSRPKLVILDNTVHIFSMVGLAVVYQLCFITCCMSEGILL